MRARSSENSQPFPGCGPTSFFQRMRCVCGLLGRVRPSDGNEAAAGSRHGGCGKRSATSLSFASEIAVVTFLYFCVFFGPQS